VSQALRTARGILAFGFAVSVELIQLTGLPSEIAAMFPPARLLLGRLRVSPEASAIRRRRRMREESTAAVSFRT
jgi:hypothetical protein